MFFLTVSATKARSLGFMFFHKNIDLSSCIGGGSVEITCTHLFFEINSRSHYTCDRELFARVFFIKCLFASSLDRKTLQEWVDWG